MVAQPRGEALEGNYGGLGCEALKGRWLQGNWDLGGLQQHTVLQEDSSSTMPCTFTPPSIALLKCRGLHRACTDTGLDAKVVSCQDRSASVKSENTEHRFSSTQLYGDDTNCDKICFHLCPEDSVFLTNAEI